MLLAEAVIRTMILMGKDTDTVGEITGEIAGARFESDALPATWRVPANSDS